MVFLLLVVDVVVDVKGCLEEIEDVFFVFVVVLGNVVRVLLVLV